MEISSYIFLFERGFGKLDFVSLVEMLVYFFRYIFFIKSMVGKYFFL